MISLKTFNALSLTSMVLSPFIGLNLRGLLAHALKASGHFSLISAKDIPSQMPKFRSRSSVMITGFNPHCLAMISALLIARDRSEQEIAFKNRAPARYVATL